MVEEMDAMIDYDFLWLDLADILSLRDFMHSVKAALRLFPKRLKQNISFQKEKLVRQTKLRYSVLKSSQKRRYLQNVSVLFFLLNCTVSPIWIMLFPQYYGIWFTIKFIVLFLMRLILFRWRKIHYYLFDFCYYANAAHLLYLWAFSYSSSMWTIIFGFNGVLGVSICLFRDAIIPHSFHRIVTAEIHMSPIILAWTLRWFIPEMHGHYAYTLCSSYSSCLKELWLYTVPAYLLWSIMYYTKMFVVSSDKIERRNYGTLYKYFAIEQGMLFKLPYCLQKYGGETFMIMHLCLFLFGLYFIPFIMNSFMLHTLFVALMQGLQLYNGIAFYAAIVTDVIRCSVL